MKSVFVSFIVVTVASFTAFAGGMSGGGGNVINPTAPRHKPNPDRVDGMIEQAFQELPAFLRTQEQKLKDGKMDPTTASLYAMIFMGTPNIYDGMKNRNLHIQEDKNCYNSYGIAYDASVVSPEPNSVCISAFSISKKVALPEIYAQVSALLVHEYSEVVGLNDDQAISIQELILAEIRGH